MYWKDGYNSLMMILKIIIIAYVPSLASFLFILANLKCQKQDKIYLAVRFGKNIRRISDLNRMANSQQQYISII